MPEATQFNPDRLRVALDHGEVVELDGGTLVVDGASFRTASEETGLSTRKIDYVKTALNWGDLEWDKRHGCLGPTPRQWQSPDGVRLPKRPNRRSTTIP